TQSALIISLLTVFPVKVFKLSPSRAEINSREKMMCFNKKDNCAQTELAESEESIQKTMQILNILEKESNNTMGKIDEKREQHFGVKEKAIHEAK
ncbi:MAG: hypothetical protein MHPSP_001579, partial [Paramarteilia canceri]